MAFLSAFLFDSQHQCVVASDTNACCDHVLALETFEVCWMSYWKRICVLSDRETERFVDDDHAIKTSFLTDSAPGAR